MTDKRNVLLLSAGRRVELLQAFKKEARARDLDAKILTTDLNPKLSAACHLADQAFAMPKVTETGYIDQLIALCEEQKVGLVIPTIDSELLGLAQAKAHFAELGAQLVISDEELIINCRDKRQTTHLFASLGIDTPKLLDRSQLTFPCFVKPYDGSRSIGAAKLSEITDLTQSMLNDPKMIFMEYIDRSYEEYTVDAYFNRIGELKSVVPRQRLEVRDGEVSKGVTRKNHVFDYMKAKLCNLKGARGCLTVQLFTHFGSQRFAALEINPRFGGGFPLSYAAGANYPGWLLDEYFLGKEISFYDKWQANLMMLRYDAQVLVSDAL